MRRLIIYTVFMAITLGLSAVSLSQNKPRLPEGAKIYIAKMENDLHTYISAEISKKKVPVTLVIEEEAAEYILTGGSRQTGDNKWYDTVFGTERDRNEGAIQLLSVKEKTIVWSGEAGDRSLWWGALKRGGQRKVADRLVNRMKKDLFK